MKNGEQVGTKKGPANKPGKASQNVENQTLFDVSQGPQETQKALIVTTVDKNLQP